MPSIAHSQEDHLRSRSSVASRSSWHPLEVENGSFDGEGESNVIIGAGASSSLTTLPLVIASTPEYRRISRNNTDDDAISLLSDPDGAGNNTPSRVSRRRGGRRRGSSGRLYQPLDMSLSQVATESKACFPVYGCASFLLSMLVAAIFVVPPPIGDPNVGMDDFALLPCRRKVWSNFGYTIEENSYDDVTGMESPANRTAEQDWSWFLQRIDQMETMDRCQNEQPEDEVTVPRYCLCNNPAQPWDPDTAAGDDEDSIEYTQLWESAFFHHRARVANETTLPVFTDLELVLVGDSLTEHWMGSSIGRPKPVYEENAQVFQNLLRDNHERRPYVHTTPFGISGDRCSQALYRIQNGAVIPSATSRLGVLTVFWVWIGTNDVIRDACKPEQVAAGTLAIVRELRKRRPDAWVVVQSLLPSENASPTVVNTINQATKCLTDSTKKAFYYNSSQVFLMPGTNTVNASRFVADGIHPNAEGSRAWARSMLDFLRALYDERYYHR